jgi:hypothetical protein
MGHDSYKLVLPAPLWSFAQTAESCVNMKGLSYNIVFLLLSMFQLTLHIKFQKLTCTF